MPGNYLHQRINITATNIRLRDQTTVIERE